MGKLAGCLRPMLAVAAAAVLVVPAQGAPISGLGTVVYADRATVGATSASVGSTVFGGDRLATAPNGSLQVRAPSARLQLAGTSSAVLLQEEASPAAILTSGTATFSTASSNAFALHVFAAEIRPNGNEPTIGQVTVLGKDEMLVKSTRGALACTVGGETRVIAEGESYRVVIAPESAAAQGPAGNGSGRGNGRAPIAGGKSKALYYIAAAVAVVTIIAVHEALESPDRP